MCKSKQKPFCKRCVCFHIQADVLVNTTGENLQLDSNPCGKALSNEAGPTLQTECTKIGKLQVGQVAATSGGNLLCDEVYHVVCVQWNNGQGEQVCCEE